MKAFYQRLIMSGYFIGLILHGGNMASIERLPDWRFQRGDPNEAQRVDYDDSNWRTVRLPHDWSIEEVPFPEAPSDHGGGFFPTGTGWYRHRLNAAEAWQGQQVSLLFEGGYRATEVWVNDEKVAEHTNGTLPFRAKISESLIYGAENIIAVRVDNTRQPNARWYTGSGLTRPVHLEVRDPLHIEPESLFVRTAYLYPEVATLEASLDLFNGGTTPASVTVLLDVIDPEGFPVLSQSLREDLGIAESKSIGANLAIGKPHLWHPDHPSLYRCVARVFEGDRLVDRVESVFGIRTLAFHADRGFLLNGQPFLLAGGNVHHDHGPLGAAAFVDAEYRKVRLLKEAGFNTLRTAHNPPSTAFLEACDRLGMLVIAEAFDGWHQAKLKGDYSVDFAQSWRRDLETFVRRDRNHPSIILWSIGNELYERGKAETIDLGREMVSLIRSLDPSRGVTIGLNGLGDSAKWPQLDGLFATVDVAGYNYELANHHEADAVRVPERVSYASESFHHEFGQNWQLAKTHPHIIGDVAWSAMDYLGESGIGRVFAPDETVQAHWEGNHFPLHGATCGLLDLIGDPRPHLHHRQLLLGSTNGISLAVVPPTPMAGEWQPSKWALPPLRSSWTWPDAEGKQLRVEVFSRQPKVRLLLNNSLVGEQSVGLEEPMKATFWVSYQPGRLVAQGLEGESVVEETACETAGPPQRILLRADREGVRPNGQDLVFVEVTVTDALGRQCPNAAISIEFSLEGPGDLIAIGSGDLASRQSYRDNPRLTHEGRALVVLRAGEVKGSLTLRARAEGLVEASLGIPVRYP